MLKEYKKLIDSNASGCCESQKPYNFLTERHLQAVWLEQKYFKNIHTVSGEPIEVISPGIWNAEAGPDFLKAHLKIGGADILGDIEIHFTDENWQQHQHHLDQRYNQVILHISFWKSAKPKTIVKHNGQSVIQTYLEENLTISATRILQLIDLDLYPYKKFLGSGRCAQSVFKNLSNTKFHDFFKSAAQWRLETKSNMLKAEACNNNPKLSELGIGIAMALGYKHNAAALLKVYSYLRLLKQHPLEVIFANSLGLCGFFEDHHKNRWNKSDYYMHLYDLFTDAKLGHEQIPLKLAQIRPINHPVRRLFFLSNLACDETIPSVQHRMLTYWEKNWPLVKDKKNLISEHLKNMLPHYQNNYWNHHYTFEVAPKQQTLNLMGEDLKKEILVNTCLPLIQANVIERQDSNEMAALIEFYASLPASNTSKTKYLSHRFFGAGKKVFKNAINEQGAYQLHRDFCIHYEASCEGCPFVDKFKEHFSY
jgi:hypothetical protein